MVEAVKEHDAASNLTNRMNEQEEKRLPAHQGLTTCRATEYGMD